MQERVERTPFWMQGNFAPVKEEVTVADLPVEGTIPPGLCGLYVRNGANPARGTSSHWFLGDGMVHGVSLKNGKAEWYRNRWVRTPFYEGEPRTLLSALDLRFSRANTHVIAHANRILALYEASYPMELSRELETRGFADFGGKLQTPCTAHPKLCPATGEMHFFGYRVLPPFLTYHVADASGQLLRSLEIPVKGPSLMHDFALTPKHAVFLDLPVLFDLPSAIAGAPMPFLWSENYGARLGVLPRAGGTVRWVDIEPCYVYHVANSFETADGTIVLDVAKYKEHFRSGASADTFDKAVLTRWTIAPFATKAAEQQLDERTIEMPRIDDRRVGQPHGTVYALVTGSLAMGGFTELLKYDLKSGRTDTQDFGGTGIPSEFTMVPAGAGAGEDEGWLLGFVYDRTRDASDLVIFDAQNISGAPLAKIRLPRRVPQGFHGSWIPDSTV